MNSEDYRWYRQHRICTRCLKVPADPGHTTCERCLMEQREHAKRKVFEMSMEEYERMLARNRDKYRILKDNGICVACRSERAVPGKTRCTECAKRHTRVNVESRKRAGEGG